MVTRDRIEVYYDRGKTAGLLFLGLAFLALALWISGEEYSGSRVWRRWILIYLGTPFFGLGASVMLTRLLLRKPALVADASGLLVYQGWLSGGPVPWSDIKDLQLLHRKMFFNRVSNLRVAPARPGAFRSKFSIWWRILSLLNRPWWGRSVEFNLNDLAADPQDLVRDLRDLHARYTGRLLSSDPSHGRDARDL